MSSSTARLDEVCSFINGGTPSKNQPEYYGGEIPWITGADIVDGRIAPARSFITDLGLSRSAANLARPGNLLLVTRTSVGKVAVATEDISFSQDITALVVDRESADVGYLKHFLRSSAEGLAAMARGATIKGVTRENVASLRLPLPPLPEQRRIAAILDHADTLRAKRKCVVGRIDELLLSEFVSRFGMPTTNPKRLPSEPIGKLGTVTTGNTPPRAQTALYGDDIEWIKSDNIDPETPFLRRASEGLSAAGMARSRIAARRSLLVTCIAGSPNSIGNVAIADRDVSFNQQITAFTPFELPTEFWYYQMRVAKRLIQDASTGGMKGLVSKSAFSEITLLVPSVDACEEYAGFVKRVWGLRMRSVRAADASTELFSSLQYASFRGEL
ncbi:restriction endonuclease subunit S [Gordonia aichiensis]|uniref:Type I restriction enzyme specificity protein n=1 Tax=Gordonia aichiensis NBRC 108223 TaxID=1220583 RepID=L7KL33_9ACTN|nr:restriction endonuclease subunit S [Gordonia aichiensis]GAC49575.1 type I restriction enzyme specificity protein [Gordonia aichiensis NBRC 108223]